MKIQDFLNAYDFVESGLVTIEKYWDDRNEFPKPYINLFEQSTLAKVRGWIYVWVAVKGDDAAVFYVGKVGLTQSFEDRMRQHVSGTRPGKSGSEAARRNAQKIRAFIDDNFEVKVYSRIATTQRIVDESVSMVSTEEEAFIQKFRRLSQPLMNR